MFFGKHNNLIPLRLACKCLILPKNLNFLWPLENCNYFFFACWALVSSLWRSKKLSPKLHLAYALEPEVIIEQLVPLLLVSLRVQPCADRGASALISVGTGVVLPGKEWGPGFENPTSPSIGFLFRMTDTNTLIQPDSLDFTHHKFSLFNSKIRQIFS